MRGILMVLVLAPLWASAQDQGNGGAPERELNQAEQQALATAHREMADCLVREADVSLCQRRVRRTCLRLGVTDICPIARERREPGTGASQEAEENPRLLEPDPEDSVILEQNRVIQD